MLGYPNRLNQMEFNTSESSALEVIIESNKPENINKPYFLILDEMNLSHVERYFTDFLSIVESNDKVRLYSGTSKKRFERLNNSIRSFLEWKSIHNWHFRY